MPEAAAIGLLIALPLLGLLAKHWVVIAFPLVGWPLFYLGLNRSWWGDGTGDGWQYGAALLTAIGVVTTAAAVGFARADWPSRAWWPRGR
jgi:hypothetical protein